MYTPRPNATPTDRILTAPTTVRLTEVPVSLAVIPDADAMLKTTLPETLRKVRKMRGMSQAELARRSGVACSTICEIESGQAQDVMLRTLGKLCGVLSVSFDYVTGFIPDDTDASVFPEASAPPTVRESRTCEHCGKALRRGEPHPPGECIIAADRRGGSTQEHREYLAPVFGLSVAAIAFICDEGS